MRDMHGPVFVVSTCRSVRMALAARLHVGPHEPLPNIVEH